MGFRLVSLALRKSWERRMLMKNAHVEKIYNMIEAEIISNLLPIKPDRSFPRDKKFNVKFPISKKDGF